MGEVLRFSRINEGSTAPDRKGRTFALDGVSGSASLFVESSGGTSTDLAGGCGVPVHVFGVRVEK